MERRQAASIAAALPAVKSSALAALTRPLVGSEEVPDIPAKRGRQFRDRRPLAEASHGQVHQQIVGPLPPNLGPARQARDPLQQRMARRIDPSRWGDRLAGVVLVPFGQPAEFEDPAQEWLNLVMPSGGCGPAGLSGRRTRN